MWYPAEVDTPIDSALLAPLLTSPRLGLVSDFDGTLSPIVMDPDQAQLTAANRASLVALAGQLALVAVITGRGAADAYQRLGIADLLVVGNHGLERWQAGGLVVSTEAARFQPQVQAAAAELEPLLAPGMQIENKGLTLSVHYRQVADLEGTRGAFLPRIQSLAGQHGLAFHEGRRVFELRPPVAQDKGRALTELAAEYNLTGVIFLGDDVTDAAALAAARRLRAENLCYGVGLGVRSEATPPEVLDQADGLLPGVPGVEDFLAWLLRSLRASST